MLNAAAASSITGYGKPPARILIADDHEVVRTGIRSMLAGNPEWEVCGEAEDGIQALEKLTALRPDIVIMDLTMPEMNGFDAAIEVKKLSPSTKVVLFSVHEIPTSARIVGADAFLAKSCGSATLRSTIQHLLDS
jgi:DNA-binding NarL/FixJ family response regulator